jgi:pyruvate/2-oxoglutarate dehydrogenase complex dihydrolipoamide acyltransferase (E2) component
VPDRLPAGVKALIVETLRILPEERPVTSDVLARVGGLLAEAEAAERAEAANLRPAAANVPAPAPEAAPASPPAPAAPAPAPVPAGRLAKGDVVLLALAYKTHADAASGPLKPGACGTIVEDDSTDKPFKARCCAPLRNTAPAAPRCGSCPMLS